MENSEWNPIGDGKCDLQSDVLSETEEKESKIKKNKEKEKFDNKENFIEHLEEESSLLSKSRFWFLSRFCT